MTTTPMYSLRTDPGGYRITKFTDGEVESSYAVTESECECPAGHRHTCRHRQMLPTMLAHGIANTHWFYLHDRSGQIVDFNGTQKHLLDQLSATAPLTPLDAVGAAQHAELILEDDESVSEAEAWSTILGEKVSAVHNNVPIIERDPLDRMFNDIANIPGVQVFGMDDLLGIHNAIADAVGEPEARIADLTQTAPAPIPHKAKPWRRL